MLSIAQRLGLIALMSIVGLMVWQEAPGPQWRGVVHAGPKQPVSDDFLVDTIRQKLAADAVVRGGAIDVTVNAPASAAGGPKLANSIEHGRPALLFMCALG